MSEPLSEAQAAIRLAAMVAADEQPVLTEDEQYELLVTARRRDRFGLYPADEGWEPTWQLYAAAAEGWRWKAGKAAGKFGFTADGHTFNREQIHQHCIRQAEHYNRLAVQSSRTGPSHRDGAGVIANL